MQHNNYSSNDINSNNIVTKEKLNLDDNDKNFIRDNLYMLELNTQNA